MIVINEFMFCRDHGAEYCSMCWCDHRPSNNIRIMGNVDDALNAQVCLFILPNFYSPWIADSIRTRQNRQPINAFYLGAVAAGRQKEWGSYKCGMHDKRNCGSCFDWANIVKGGLPVPATEELQAVREEVDLMALDWEYGNQNMQNWATQCNSLQYTPTYLKLRVARIQPAFWVRGAYAKLLI